MRIDNNLSALQTLQARQGFTPRRKQTAATSSENTPNLTQPEPTQLVNSLRPKLPVQEIQQVARQLGYLDVSEQVIKKAYLQGQSLLADYRA